MKIYKLAILIITVLTFFVTGPSRGVEVDISDLSSKTLEKKTLADIDTSYDPTFDYSTFPGRVTDIDASPSILKITSENKNIKFFKTGDPLSFNVARLGGQEYCKAYVKTVERNYFVVSVKDFNPCWKQTEYFRRGTQLIIRSEALAKRVKEASIHRLFLKKQKNDFLHQLNDINNYVSGYRDNRQKVESEYDKEIVKVQKAKLDALKNIKLKEKDYKSLKQLLSHNLQATNEKLNEYRVEKHISQTDRWATDLHLGLPVGNRPQELKEIGWDTETTIGEHLRSSQERPDLLKTLELKSLHRLFTFYTASLGNFQEDYQNGLVIVKFKQNSPVTLGLGWSYTPEDGGHSYSSSAYLSYITSTYATTQLSNSVQNSIEGMTIPLEKGINFYFEKKFETFIPYFGFDYEDFSIFNTSEIIEGEDLQVKSNKLYYATIGFSKLIPWKDYDFLFKASVSQTLSSKTSVGTTFTGYKYILYFKFNLSDKLLFHVLYKQHNLEGSSKLSINRIGAGIGWLLL